MLYPLQRDRGPDARVLAVNATPRVAPVPMPFKALFGIYWFEMKPLNEFRPFMTICILLLDQALVHEEPEWRRVYCYKMMLIATAAPPEGFETIGPHWLPVTMCDNA